MHPLVDSTTPTQVDSGDLNSVELGVKFRSDVNGFVDGLRFFKSAANTGTHVGSLWTSTGTLLAEGTFSNESASGWQQLSFTNPVPVTANTTYVVSYHTTVGHYSFDSSYFVASGVDNGPLHGLASGVDGPNGVFVYSDTPSFPNNSFNSTNYWVDPVFNTIATTDDYSYAAGGGTGTAPATGSGLDGTTITLAANTFAKTGYTFAGWNDGTTTYPAASPYTLSSGGAAIVFTAQWTPNATDGYSYAAGGGTGTAPASSSGLDGTTITLAANPFTYLGHTFAGWSDGTLSYPAGATYTLSSVGASIVFTAQWTPNATDGYSYAAGGGTGTAPASSSGLDGTTITLAANPFTYLGHTFAGWSDGTLSYPAGATYTLSSVGAPIVFTAQWSDQCHRHRHL